MVGRFLGVVPILLAVLFGACEVMPEYDSEFTGTGGPVDPADWPGVALMRQVQGNKVSTCSGALVQNDKVLFAAHCVILQRLTDADKAALDILEREMRTRVNALRGQFSIFASEADVIAAVAAADRAGMDAAMPLMRAEYERTPKQGSYSGDVYLGGEGEHVSYDRTRRVVGVEVHEGFWQSIVGAGINCVDTLAQGTAAQAIKAYATCLKNRELAHDFAIATLDRPVYDIHPMRLATPELAANYLTSGADVISLGYGGSYGFSDFLHGTELTVDSHDCFNRPGECTAGVELMAVGKNSLGVCKGDSGGPLVLDTPEGKLVVGVASSAIQGDPDAAEPCSRRTQFGRTDAMAGGFFTQVWTPPPPEAQQNPRGRSEWDYEDDGGGCSSTPGGALLFALLALVSLARSNTRSRYLCRPR